MKYYTYISDAKVDMLFPQVPHDIKKKVATEFGIDLKFLSAKRKAEAEPEENRITRLEVVAEFIRNSGKVGSVDDPNEYIADILQMWNTTIEEIFYLTGRTEKTFFGMGGSLQHVIGSAAKSELPQSIAGVMFNSLRKFLNEESPQTHADETFLSIFMGVADSQNNWLKGPTEKFEFLAKRLWYESWTSKNSQELRALLATPLYVAKAD